MIRRLWSIMRKEFIQIVRDPRTLAITFVMPIVMLLLLGYAATTDVRNVPMVVFDQDRSAQSRDLIEAFRRVRLLPASPSTSTQRSRSRR